MSEYDFDQIFSYLTNALSDEENDEFEIRMNQDTYLREIVDGLKKIEAEVPEGMTLREYLILKKEYLNFKLFGKNKK